MSEKKLRIRDHLKSFSRLTFNSEFDALRPDQRSDVLLNFYIKEIHNKLRTEITDEQFELGHVDNKGDLTVDFIHKDDGIVTIIQSKYRGANTKSEDRKTILEFKNSINMLMNENFNGNKKIREILSDIDFENDKFELYFITTGIITGDAKTESNIDPIFESKIKDLSDRVTCTYLDETDLNDEIRNAAKLSISFNEEELELYAYGAKKGSRQILTIEIDGRKQCIFAVESTHLVNAHNRVKDNLFNLNIRNYIGNTNQNKKIKETIEKEPNNFYFFNNGISCLTKEITVDNETGLIKVKGLHVINGAQTVKSLVLSHRKKTINEKPIVLVRITEISENYEEKNNFIDSITRYNNSQNIVKVSDFRSNDLIQIDIQKKFSKINLPNTSKNVLYLRKRTDEVKRTHEIVKFEDFSKALHAYMIDPITFSSSTSYLFDADENGGYTKIFGDGLKVDDFISDEEFEKRAAIWWLCKGFTEQIAIDKKSADSLTKNALQGRWLIIYASRLLLERFLGDPYTPISKHYKSGWVMGVGKIGTWYMDLYNLSKQTVNYLYTNDSTSSGFLHRNWLRSQSTVDKIKKYCLNAPIKEISPSPSKD